MFPWSVAILYLVCDAWLGQAFEEHIPCGMTQKVKNGVLCDCSSCDSIWSRQQIETDACCECRSYLILDLSQLQVEYTTLGDAVVLGDKGNNSVLKHNNGGLLFIPSNICAYPNIRRLDLSGNMIVDVQDMSCLGKLDELKLERNLISSLKQDTFAGMFTLRILDLSQNNIHTMEVGTLGIHLPQLKSIDLSYNELETFDISNFNLYSFCEMNLNNNKLRKLVNNESLKTEMLEHRGPGMVDFQFNNLTIFPDWEQLNVGNISSLGLLSNWGFDIRDNHWICDCMLYSFVMLAQKHYKAIDGRDYFNVRCENPPEYRGEIVIQMDPGKLVCNLTELCPSVCTCTGQPSVLNIFVDCVNAGLTELPFDLPDIGGLSLVIDLTGNSISVLDGRPYLSRVRNLDLSNNDITRISPQAARQLINASEINLEGNKISILPKEIQLFPPSVIKLKLDHIICNCTLSWMADWMEINKFNETHSTCVLEDTETYISLREYLEVCTPEDLTPFIVGGILGTLAVVVVVSTILSYVFRYELLVLAHYYVSPKWRKWRSRVQPTKENDIYISVSDDVIVWVKDNLIPDLENDGVSVFVPERDTDPGDVEIDAIMKGISNSQNAFVAISPDYLESQSKMEEFNFLCQSLVRGFSGVLCLIITENIGKTKNPYLSAFMRVKLYHCGMDGATVSKSLHKIKPIGRRRQ
ncbi:protein slit-like [Haliotis rufescens]|uniref:protein slit-like n=1 Tax=Haliotis rufescens TaxID=6454 RepID=UPI00201FB169|nr:protein slit-like [Haliotis rufescens]